MPGSADPARPGDPLTRGRAALAAARWAEARDAFQAALDATDDPDALDGLGEALWFLGEITAGVAAHERAFDGHVRAGGLDAAARTAAWVADQHHLAGRTSAARGWLARAERALGGAATPGSGAGAGWVAVGWAQVSDGAADRAGHAQRALDVARRCGDAELEVLALSALGHADRGMLHLEEALATATAAHVGSIHTVGEAYCHLLSASVATGDLRRTIEWCVLVDDFARTHGIGPLLGVCRAHHADVLVATGRWEEAETALESALATHARHIPALGAPAVATLAELRLRQGRLPDALALLADRDEDPAILRALALARLAEGRAAEAAGLLRRALADTAGDAVAAASLLGPLADALLATGRTADAGIACERLAQIALATGSEAIGARADLAAARLALAEGDAGVAADHARRALAAYGRLGMPHDGAEARLELARALVADEPDLAADEARTALATFRSLGAARAADRAAAALRSLGAGTPPGARVAGELTAREREVLELIARGMSNAQIARTLVISEKTAGHHVSHILAKLGARNRAEAAAHAARAATGGRMGNG